MKKYQLLICLFLLNLYVYAQEISEAPFSDAYKKHMNNKSGHLKSTSTNDYTTGIIPSPFEFHFSKSMSNLKADTLPSFYDLRTINDGGYLTTVKDQGNSGTCWTFATFGSVESYLLKQGKGSFDLSEQNLATCHGFDFAPDEGGNAYMSTAYQTRHAGPVTETEDPYTEPDENTSCRSNLTPAIFVEQAIFFPGSNDDAFDPNTVKQAIMNYGALHTSVYWDSDYYNKDNYTYFYTGDESVNHGVLLVGWDDDKEVTAGNSVPDAKGAWIIRNSWDTDWGEEGYFYVSYEDTKALSSLTCFPSAIDYSSGSNAYYYDECGNTTALGYKDETAYGLVKFTSNGAEQVTRIGTYAISSNTCIKIELYEDFDGTDLTGFLGETEEKTCAMPGFYTFDIEDIILNSNANFYVKIYYNTPDYNYPLPMESQIDNYSENTTISEGKCWISNDCESWLALGANTDYSIDLCIKAYTRNVDENTLIADFDADVYEGDSILKVNFTDLSNGDPTSWEWDFNGDGEIDSYDQNPVYTYTEDGLYAVTLTISNDTTSNTITKNNYITVGEIHNGNELDEIYSMCFNTTDDISDWYIINNNYDDYKWALHKDAGISSSRCAGYQSSVDSIANDWLVSPTFYFDSAEEYRLNFYYKVGEEDKPENLTVYLITASDTVSDRLVNLNDLTNESYNLSSTKFSPLSSGDYKIGFYCFSAAGMDQLLIDNFTISKNNFLSIEEIQETDDESGDSPYSDQIITTKGIVTYKYESATTTNLYIQDAEKQWSGIWVYDIEDICEENLQIGDEIYIIGAVDEYYGLTEIDDIISLGVLSQDNTINPIQIDLSDINESYESVLVELNNIYCSQTSDDIGEWKISDGTNELKVDNLYYSYSPTLNEEFSSLTGILTYDWDKYKLQIRNSGEVLTRTTGLADATGVSYYVNIYPNPTEGKFKIEFTNQNQIPEKVYINTVIGKRIMSTYLNDNEEELEINLSPYNRGIYMIELVYADTTSSFKVIKK